MNAQIAEILGAFIGDGWIEKRGTALYITGDSTEDKPYYDFILAPMFSRVFTKVLPRHFPYWQVYGLVTYKQEVILKAKALGFQDGKKVRLAKIPDDILSSGNKKVMAAVLRGIFDTDGSFFCGRARGKQDCEWRKKHHCCARIEIKVVSKVLIDNIKRASEYLGIRSPPIKTTKAEFRNNKNNSEAYSFVVNRKESIKKWFELVKPHNPKHLTKYQIWKKFGFIPPYTKLRDRRAILNGELNPEEYYK